VNWTSDHSPTGPGELVTLNLTQYIGSANTLVRFYYYAPAWDYWFQVDQVNVLGCIVPDVYEADQSFTQFASTASVINGGIPDPHLMNNSASVDVEVEIPPVTQRFVYMPLMFRLSGAGTP
jgi:hypothetical protein